MKSVTLQSIETVYETAAAIASSSEINMLRMPKYQAEATSDAKARYALGESGRGKGQHVGHAEFVSSKVTGLSWNPKGNKATIILTFRDLTSKDPITESADYRTCTIADLGDMSRNIQFIEVAKNFGKFEWINLAKRLFPFPSEKEQADLALGLLECLQIGGLIDSIKAKITYLKKKADKGNPILGSDGSKLVYSPPVGNVLEIVDSDGNRLQRVKRAVKRIRLSSIVQPINLNDKYPDWTESGTGRAKGTIVLKSDLSLLPLYVAELERLRNEYVEKYSAIRPLELGIIEQSMTPNGFPETVTVCSEVFEVEVNEDYEYDLPADTAEKLGSGEYKKSKVSKVRGSWELIPAPVKQKV